MDDQQMLTSLPVPTQDERTMAFLAHLLQVFTGFIAPLVIYCVKQDSRFVKFHALQCLIWQLCYMAVFIGGMVIFFFSMFATVFSSAPGGHTANQPPTAIFLVFPLFWLFWMLGWVANVILGIMYGMKANRGEWAVYPIIGKWCLPKLAPGSAGTSPTWAP
ncbi:MAG: DUF4870 domain-containing protein [Candidatus Acidiferrales bacterium]